MFSYTISNGHLSKRLPLYNAHDVSFRPCADPYRLLLLKPLYNGRSGLPIMAVAERPNCILTLTIAPTVQNLSNIFTKFRLETTLLFNFKNGYKTVNILDQELNE